MTISIVLPYINLPDIANTCIEYLVKNTVGSWELILINNGSDRDPKQHPRVPAGVTVKTLHFAENQGLPMSLLHGLNSANGDIIYFGHTDTLIHEHGWDQKVTKAFEDDPKLGMAGFFGAMIWGDNGGRAECYSNLQGKVWGAAWHQGQSQHLEGVRAAATLDGLGLVFRSKALQELQAAHTFLSPSEPPHHMYDRVWPAIFIDGGWHVATIGVACDHRGGTTANSSEEYHSTARKWCEKYGVYWTGNSDHSVYLEAERRMFAKYQHRLPLIVNHNYEYKWSG